MGLMYVSATGLGSLSVAGIDYKRGIVTFETNFVKDADDSPMQLVKRTIGKMNHIASVKPLSGTLVVKIRLHNVELDAKKGFIDHVINNLLCAVRRNAERAPAHKAVEPTPKGNNKKLEYVNTHGRF